MFNRGSIQVDMALMEWAIDVPQNFLYKRKRWT